MNIAVISPHTNRNGNTVVASFIALELANRGRTVCLTSGVKENKSMLSYFNIAEREDKTNSPYRLLRMIKEDAIKGNEISDYCKAVSNKLDIFTACKKEFKDDESKYMTEYICENFPHEYVIFDIDDSVDNEDMRIILNNSDIIILNISQDSKELEELKVKLPKLVKMFTGTPMVVVVNKYNNIQGKVKDIAKMVGVNKPNKWITVRYNPWIGYSTNNKYLVNLFGKMKNGDIRVADINSDINTVVGMVSKVKTAKNSAKRIGTGEDKGEEHKDD